MTTKECVLCGKIEESEIKSKNKLYFICKKCDKQPPNTLQMALWNVETTIDNIKGSAKEQIDVLNKTKNILKKMIKKEITSRRKNEQV